ncbi:MAG: hypothetical protein JW807_14100 [Spirochaetes bacterium]|nr:hypothetical protein [Spirochaetota bacterium]
MPVRGQQPEYETPAERTIRRFRSQESLERTAKRKRFSTGLFVVNLALIVVLYIFFSSRKPGEEYQSTSFNYGKMNFRFSIARERESRDYIFSLSTRTADGGSSTIRFTGGMADLVITHGGTLVAQKPVGRNIASLSLKAGETDTQNAVLDRYELQVFADGHPETVASPKRSLIQFEKPHIPLQAEIRIHVDRPVSTSLNFKYEVER